MAAPKNPSHNFPTHEDQLAITPHPGTSAYNSLPTEGNQKGGRKPDHANRGHGATEHNPESPQQRRLRPPPGFDKADIDPAGTKRLRSKRPGAETYGSTYTSSCPRVKRTREMMGVNAGISGAEVGASWSSEKKTVMTYEYTIKEEDRKKMRETRVRGSYTNIEGSSGTPYLVVGIFNGPERVPKERVLCIRRPKWVFWQLWYNIVRLRGISYFLSLKDVKQFKLYQCDWVHDSHEHINPSSEEETTLSAFQYYYRSWALDNQDWTFWIHENMNYGSFDLQGCPLENAFSLEIILGWSAFRIIVIVIAPILVSLAVGLSFQARDPTDLVTIQTAWGIATYVVTAGALVAALLGVLSGIENK